MKSKVSSDGLIAECLVIYRSIVSVEGEPVSFIAEPFSNSAKNATCRAVDNVVRAWRDWANAFQARRLLLVSVLTHARECRVLRAVDFK